VKEYEALLQRMEEEQVKILQSAAKAGVLPTDNMLAKIADLELAIGAVEALLDSDAARS